MYQRIVLEVESGVESGLEFTEGDFHVFQADFRRIGLTPFHLSVKAEGEGGEEHGMDVSARIARYAQAVKRRFMAQHL